MSEITIVGMCGTTGSIAYWQERRPDGDYLVQAEKTALCWTFLERNILHQANWVSAEDCDRLEKIAKKFGVADGPGAKKEPANMPAQVPEMELVTAARNSS